MSLGQMQPAETERALLDASACAQAALTGSTPDVSACAIEVGPAAGLALGGRLVVRLTPLEMDVLVIRTRRGIFALENACTHLGSALEYGQVRRKTIRCPAHGKKFDLASGLCVNDASMAGRSLHVLRAWIEHDRVWLQR